MLDQITEKIGTGPENIRIIEDFVDKEDLEKLVMLCKRMEQSPNPGRSYTIIPTLDMLELREKYTNKMIESSSEYYSSIAPIRNYTSSSNYQKASFLIYPEGSFLHPHIDIVGLVQDDGDIMEDPMEKWTGHLASIIYLNDDYVGGEISFPNRGISIKPSAGSLVSFPGNKHYVHEVKKISSGIRLTLSMWIRFAEADGNIAYAHGAEK